MNITPTRSVCLTRAGPSFLAGLVLIAGAVSLARAEEPAGAPKAKNSAVARLRQYYQETAAGYEVRFQDAAKTKLLLQAAPVMHWNSFPNWNGSVFLWTHQGRPELICSIHSSGEEGPAGYGVGDELHSLSLGALSVVGPNGRRWEPKGLEGLRVLPGAPTPADSAARRQLQIKELVRDFTAHVNVRGDRWELRLLPQPLYKYDGPDLDVLSGAVFTFVGFITDPEIILLLEARRTPQGPKWHYLPARFSNKSLWLEYRNRPVWESLRRGHESNQPDTVEPQYGQVFRAGVRLPPGPAGRRGGP